MRKNFVLALLRCLSELGYWRENCGREPMHKYYTGFDWLDDTTIDELLPESGIPTTLKIEDLEDEDTNTGFSRTDFCDWLWEGRHDCDVAFAVLRLWTSTLRGSGNATLDELFDQFLEFTEPSDTVQARGVQNFLPVAAIAAAIQHFEHVPFDTSGMNPEGFQRSSLSSDHRGARMRIRVYNKLAWYNCDTSARPKIRQRNSAN